MGKVQIGRGFEKLYRNVKDCDDYNLQNVMMGLSEDCVDSISCCIKLYLSEHIGIEDENIRKIVDEKEYMNKDLIDFASRRYSLKEKKNFLCSHVGHRGNDVAKLACYHLLPKVIVGNNQKLKERIKQILRLKRKIKKLRKGEDHEESGSDEDDVDDGEGDEQSDDVDSDEEGEERGNDEDKVAKEGEQSESEETEAEED